VNRLVRITGEREEQEKYSSRKRKKGVQSKGRAGSRTVRPQLSEKTGVPSELVEKLAKFSRQKKSQRQRIHRLKRACRVRLTKGFGSGLQGAGGW